MAAAGTLEPADLVGNLRASDTATGIREERDLGRGDEARLWEGTGLGNMAGNHGNSAACCTQGC